MSKFKVGDIVLEPHTEFFPVFGSVVEVLPSDFVRVVYDDAPNQPCTEDGRYLRLKAEYLAERVKRGRA